MSEHVRRFPYAILVLDALGTGPTQDQTLPGGGVRYAGTPFEFAATLRDLEEIGRALGIARDVAILTAQGLPCVQIPTATLRRARIDPILQYVNERAVLDHQDGTAPLERLKAACAAARSPSARAFLIAFAAGMPSPSALAVQDLPPHNSPPS